MITRISFLTSIVICLISLVACDNKTESKTTNTATAADSITVVNPHIRALPPGQKVTAMYMQLKNSSATNHDLVKVDGDISNMIEIHTHTMDNGVMRMGQVESIPVAANSTAEAKPGSYHVMIMGLKEDPKLGDKFNFTFTFKDGSSLPVTAEVKKIDVNSH